jgi:hypothetical protein
LCVVLNSEELQSSSEFLDGEGNGIQFLNPPAHTHFTQALCTFFLNYVFVSYLRNEPVSPKASAVQHAKVYARIESVFYRLCAGTGGREDWGVLLFGATAPRWARASSFTRFLDHTQRRTTVVKTPLDE